MVRAVSATLLDVPFDPRYRVKLRAYMFDDDNEAQHVRTTVRIDTHGSSISRAFTLDLRRTCQPAQCAYTPLYGELDIPSGASGARANLYVRSQGLLTWAFASVTNNTTQQVTIINADGAGGDPCRNCSER